MIRVSDVHVAIDGAPILHGVSFEVQPGSVAGYVGPNGAGKTTTMRLLTGALPPDSGRVEVGGVDVVADIEFGITSVREVVQAKRHKRTIQRKDLDALRGSLYRFNAVRGTIIATAPFSKGTAEAAFATGAAPITLIDGDKLIDLLIEHGIGVKKNKIEVLSVDADAFADLEPEA